jgi:hypothetical protein
MSVVGTKRECRNARAFPVLGIDRLCHQHARYSRPDPKRTSDQSHTTREDRSGNVRISRIFVPTGGSVLPRFRYPLS